MPAAGPILVLKSWHRHCVERSANGTLTRQTVPECVR